MNQQPLIVKRTDGEVLRVMGSEVKFVCRGDRTNSAWSLIECAAPKEVGPPPHHHAWDEAYFITAGEVRFSIDGAPLTLRTGDFILIPAGCVHGFAGASDDARMLIFDAPAHAEGFFRDAALEVRDIPRDLPKVPEIGARHGIHFLPPPR
jgi:quercetin dioxygenase-like cupin family protein